MCHLVRGLWGAFSCLPCGRNVILKNDIQTTNESWRNQKGNKNLETNENGKTTYQNQRDFAKAVLRGKFRVINAYIKEKERLQTTYIYTSRKLEQLSSKLAERRK